MWLDIFCLNRRSMVVESSVLFFTCILVIWCVLFSVCLMIDLVLNILFSVLIMFVFCNFWFIMFGMCCVLFFGVYTLIRKFFMVLFILCLLCWLVMRYVVKIVGLRCCLIYVVCVGFVILILVMSGLSILSWNVGLFFCI